MFHYSVQFNFKSNIKVAVKFKINKCKSAKIKGTFKIILNFFSLELFVLFILQDDYQNENWFRKWYKRKQQQQQQQQQQQKAL